MIRRNSSNLIPSTTDSPTYTDHLTAAEGIHIDKPVTGLNHVKDSVNFELTNENTYILRKPIMFRADNYVRSVLLYDKEYEFIVYNASSIKVTKRDARTGTDYDITFRCRDVNNNIVEANIATVIPYVYFSNDVKAFNTANTTVLQDVAFNLKEISNLLKVEFYNTALYSDEYVKKVYRYCSIYRDEDTGKWYFEMLNPEVNTFTGGDSATEFNPNVLLDNPYAIKDLYGYGANSVTQILPYISKDTVSSEVTFTKVLESGLTIYPEDAIFEIVHSEGLLTVVSKVNILGILPEAFNSNNDAFFQSFSKHNLLDIKISVRRGVGTYGNTFTFEASFNKFIPAGTKLATMECDLSTIDMTATVTVSVTSSNSIYLIPAGVSVEKFNTVKAFEYEIQSLRREVFNGFSLKNTYGLDIVFNNDQFKMCKYDRFDTANYIAITDVTVTEDDAFTHKVYFQNENIERYFTTDMTLKIWLWNSEYVEAPKHPNTVAELTEQVVDLKYDILSTVNSDNDNDILLKAFVTTQYLSNNYYCNWEVSEDAGVTWNIAPEFVSKFKDKFLYINVQSFKSNETLTEASKYYEKRPVVPFSTIINSSKDLISERPDILPVSGKNVKFKYRFNIYRHTDVPKQFSDMILQYSPNVDMFKIDDKYIFTKSVIHYIYNENETSEIRLRNYIYLKVTTDETIENYTLKAYGSSSEEELSDLLKYSTISYETVDTHLHNGKHVSVLKVSNLKQAFLSNDSHIVYYKLALFDSLNNVIPNLKCTLIEFIHNIVSSVAHDDYLEGSSSGIKTVYNYIPNLYFQITYEEGLWTAYNNVGTGNSILNAAVESFVSGNPSTLKSSSFNFYEIRSETEERSASFSYHCKGTIYNNSNMNQVAYIDLMKIIAMTYSQLPNGTDYSEEVRRNLRLLKINESRSEGTLNIGTEKYTFTIKTEDVRNRNTVKTGIDLDNRRSIQIPAKTSISFEIKYHIFIATDSTYKLTSNTIFVDTMSFLCKVVMGLSLHTISGTYVLNKSFDSSNKWFMYNYGSVNYPNETPTIPKSTNTYKDSYFKNTEYNQYFGRHIPVLRKYPEFEEASDVQKVSTLVSQKEYTFNVNNFPNETLGSKRIPLETGKVLYHNNQIFTYGVKGYENNIYISNTDSYITPMFNSLDLAYGFKVTKILPWRNYLVIFTKNSIHLASYDDTLQSYVAKTVSTSVGLSEIDAETAVDILNGVLFKSGEKVYKLVPNLYAATDNILNLSCISNNIEFTRYNASDADNFAFTTDEKYYLFTPDMYSSNCYIYNYLTKSWTKNTYPTVFKKYEFVNSSDIRLYNNSKQFFFDKLIEEVYTDIDQIPHYGDCISRPVFLPDGTVPNITPIPFSIDFGQKASNYSENKQFLGTRLIFQTLSEKDSFPMDITVSTDGMLRKIHIDESTDGALLKTSLNTTGVLATYQPAEDSQVSETLRQLMIKYSGRGKTIRHYIEGSSMYRFKFYSLDYKYRILPKK